ncbi:MAG: amino acid adenylation domain-containing protein, partial [bacterium]|nr:amino acid adenylation domain-containing protein [bacterium]
MSTVTNDMSLLIVKLKESGISISLTDDDNIKLSGAKGKLNPALLKELKEKKTEIIAFLKQSQKKSKLVHPAIKPVEKKNYYELSFAQRRLWVLCQFVEDSIAYNMPIAMELFGKFDIDIFKRALQTVVNRHDSLKTVFLTVNGEPKQKILETVKVDLPVVELRELEEAAKEEMAKEIYLTNANHVFDLVKGPLFIFKIIRLEDEKCLLVGNVHHIVSDGWSQGVIRNEILILYNAFEENKKNPLPPLTVQYKDYTLWHNQLIAGDKFTKAGEYWLEKFKDKPNGIELPADHPRRAIQTFNGGRISRSLDKKRTMCLEQLIRQHDVTLFMGLLALLSLFLHKISGKNDIILGAPVAGRKEAALHNMVGFLVNTLVYRNRVDPAETFVQLLEKVKQETLEAYEAQDYPFDLLVERLELDRDLSQSPLFNVMVAHNNADIEDENLGIDGVGSGGYEHEDEFNMSKFDWAVIINMMGNQIFVTLEYNSDLFERSTAERLGTNFIKLMESVLEQPEIAISQLEYIEKNEYDKIIRIFNDTEMPFKQLTIKEHFEQQVEKTPAKTAVVHDKESITYEALNRKANQLAHYLRDRFDVKPNDVIGVFVDRSIEMIAVILGIIKSGAGYLSVDPNYPQERIRHILEDSNCKLVIAERDNQDLPTAYEGERVDVASGWEIFASKPVTNPGTVNKLADIVYVIYTSGSTGTPNGAMLSHHLLSNLVLWQTKTTGIDSSLRCLQFTSINFCVSFQEITTTLSNGGELYLIGDVERQDIEYLMNFLSRNKIEILYLPFSYLNFLFNESGRWGESFEHSLKHIITAGEQLKITSSLKRFLERSPGLKLHNHYGSSEMHVVTSYTLDASSAGEKPVPPAGKPIANTKIYILDEYRKPVPVGVWGELCIAGAAEVAGYINNSALTDEKLLKHPQLSEDGKRLYCSGDMGRWLENGNIELKGRKDSQVKVRGFRVELTEIESKLFAIDNVKDCVVVVREDKQGQKYLAAYVVLEDIESAEVKRMLDNSLPQHMVPKLVAMTALPLMSNGKVDREKLPDPYSDDILQGYIDAAKVSALLHDDAFTRKLSNNMIMTDTTPLEEIVAYLTYSIQQTLFKKNPDLFGVATGVITAEKRKELLLDMNRPGMGYPEDKTMIRLFEDRVEKNPHYPAVLYGDERLSFAELNEKANRLGHYLRTRGVEKGTVVGIMSERMPETITPVLAVLKAGGAYMEVEPNAPQKQVLARLKETDVTLLLATSNNVENYSYCHLQGIQKAGNELHMTAPQPAITDIDSLPIPDRSLVDYEKYSRYIGITLVRNCITLFATRGCPYNCAYCHKIWPKNHIVRSAENILSEVQLYYDMGVRRFAFLDDIFNFNKENSESFFRLIIEKGLDVQLYFSGGLRGDILTREYIDLMVEAGTVSIALALESASPRIQKLIGKNLRVERFRENVEYIAEKYPHVILEVHSMHGFPTETEEEALMTLDFIKSIKWFDFPYIHIVKIYPNTPMMKLALDNGVSMEDIIDAEGKAFHEVSGTTPFENSFTMGYQADFLNEYFLSHERLKKVLPHQMRVLTENDIVQKYNSYLPVEIKSLDELLEFIGLTREELGEDKCCDESLMTVPHLNEKIRSRFPQPEAEANAPRLLLMDLSQFMGSQDMLYDVVESPLGLISLLTYLNREMPGKINGKIIKARIDFENYGQLKTIVDDFKPDIIGIRTLTFYKDFFHQTASMLRHWGVKAPIIAGGPYATSDYDTILK